MSEPHVARAQALDSVTDQVADDHRLAEDIWSIVEFIENEPVLRRHLGTSSAPEQARAKLIDGLFAGKVSDSAISVLSAASGMRWGDGLTLASALERQGVRVILARADKAGRLDEVETQLFGILTMVRENPEIGAALAERQRSEDDRRRLLERLIAGKVAPDVAVLAARAVAARNRTFELTLEHYLTLAAAQRKRGIASIRVARPLNESQRARLLSTLITQFGRPLTMEITVDPAVLGGVHVTVGDEVIDGTVSSRLETAHRAFH